MSRKALIITALVVVLVATLVAPATAASLNESEVVSVRSEGWLDSGANPSGPGVPIQLTGDCEGGSGGGCPVSG